MDDHKLPPTFTENMRVMLTKDGNGIDYLSLYVPIDGKWTFIEAKPGVRWVNGRKVFDVGEVPCEHHPCKGGQMSEDEIRKEFETWFEHKMSLAPLSMNNSLRMGARELMLESYLACRNAVLEEAAKACDGMTYPLDIEVYSSMTKKEHSEYACRQCAAAIRALKEAE